MKLICLYYILFFNSILPAYPLVQKWNLIDSSIDLLANTDNMAIKEFEEEKDNLYIQLYKWIQKENGTIVSRNNLKIAKDNMFIFEGDVNFDKIESIYYINNNIIVCPKGKYHPVFFYGNQYSNLSLPNFKEKGDWELKCYHHYSGYFLVFYLMNKDSQLFYKYLQNDNWKTKVLHEEIYDFKLVNEEDSQSNIEYPFTYIIKEENNIWLYGSKITLTNDGIYPNDCCGRNLITKAKDYSRGCFEKNYDHFYFF